MSRFEVIRGVEGCCLSLDDTRIAGPKPWGGGTVVHSWETDKEYKAVDTKSQWYELFGTPERAARTLEKGKTLCEWCDKQACSTSGGECRIFDHDALLEWLRGDAE